MRSLLADRAPSSYARTMVDDAVGIAPAIWDEMVAWGGPACSFPRRTAGSVWAWSTLWSCSRRWDAPVPRSVLVVGRARHHGRGPAGARRPAGVPGHRRDPRHGRSRRSRPRRSGRPRPHAGRAEVRRWLLNGRKPVVVDGHTADWASSSPVRSTGSARSCSRARAVRSCPSSDLTRKVARLELDVGRPSRSDPTAITPRSGSAWPTTPVALCCRVDRRRASRPTTWPSSTPRSGCSSTGRSRRSRRSSTRPRTCSTASSWRGWARTTRRGPDATTPVAGRGGGNGEGVLPEAVNEVCAECIQIHGGVGFTWDCDAHLFYRRAKQDDLLLGYQGWHRQRLADHDPHRLSSRGYSGAAVGRVVAGIRAGRRRTRGLRAAGRGTCRRRCPPDDGDDQRHDRHVAAPATPVVVIRGGRAGEQGGRRGRDVVVVDDVVVDEDVVVDDEVVVGRVVVVVGDVVVAARSRSGAPALSRGSCSGTGSRRRGSRRCRRA